jgi:tetratricopeptide (TPR) repeat protein
VKGLLGEGGKKKVYKAYDTLLDREVALALIKVEGLDEDSRIRITREAQAMGRLGAHNNIVTVFDLGDHEGQPYIVQELMAGRDVEKLIQSAPDNRLSIDQTIEIAQSVSAGLEYAHGKGVLHRDIKPSNIWLTEDGSVKIGDFGLALVDDRTRLTQEGMTVGTVSYLPPEQAIGTEVTPQSDLYSLGAMLYEMVTGRPPFIGDDTIAIIGQHLNTPPVSPSWHNPEIPPAMEVLILRLLEKNAAQRFASALEMGRALESIQRGTIEEEPGKEDAQEEKSGPLYRQVFVGREIELNQLKTAFDNAISGDGSLSMVVGEPGIGKTSLCEQLATYVTMRGGLTLVGHCYEEGSLSLPYLAFVEAMRTYVLDRDIIDLRNELGSGASEVARIVSEVRDKLQIEPRPATDPDEDRYRLFQAVSEFLSNAANIQPLLIVLEDLHDSDKGTLDLLTHITRRMDKHRLLILGTYRDIEVDRAHPLTNALAELRRVSSYSRILLRGLTVDEVHRMLSGLSGRDVPWQMAEVVHHQTEGNPLFVQEVLRYVIEDGLLVREGDQWRTVSTDRLATSIPEGLRDVIGKRLSTLSPECNQVLAVASVIGREFRFEVLQKVAGIPEDDLYKAIEEARTVSVIEERTAVGASVTYRFNHAFFRQTLYEEMIAPRRNRLHQQIARALEEMFAPRLEDHASALADHFSHSTGPEDLSKAVYYGEMAAERATSVFDFGEAVRLLVDALQVQEVLNPEDKEKRCDLLISLCDALMMSGTPRRVLDKEAPAALTLAEEIGDKNRGALICTKAISALMFYGAGPGLASPETADWANKLDQYAAPDTIERAQADCCLGIVEYYNNNYPRAAALLKESLDLARRLGDMETFHMSASMWLNYVAAPQHSKERFMLAEEFFEKTFKGVSLFMRFNIMFQLGNVYLALAQYDRVEEIFSRFSDLSEKINLPNLYLSSLGLKSLRASIEGDLEEAVDITRQMLDIGRDSEFSLYAQTLAVVCGLRPRLYLGKAEAMLNNFIMRPVNPMSEAWGLSLLGRMEEASSIMDQIIQARSSISVKEDESWGTWDIILLESATITGHEKMAERVLNRFANADQKTTGIYYTTVINRHLGAGALMLGRINEAKQHYMEAIKVAEDLQFRPELALTRFQLAELLLEHYPQEREDALEHLEFAISEFEEMKMNPSLDKARALKERL